MSAAPAAENTSSRVHRSQSARHPSTAPNAHTHRQSADHTGNLSHVARRDFEQSNVAQIPRRSVSRDNSGNAPPPTRSDSTRAAQSSRERRYASIDANAGQQSTTNGATNEHTSSSRHHHLPHIPHPHLPHHSNTVQRKRTYVTCATGTWILGKTIGQGSMGKVKLAKNQDTGEQVAVKIVPRQSTDEHRTPAERERADHSKEVRTAREAAIVSLTNHPYICGMRDVYRTNYHWYMLFEYVNGGQMLDYIISHGRLKEKGARKFARQIASALDYCHRNSIVHRDLKIENILISKTGDIKIIDFGLSNLFSPQDHLKTFCGSLYFAAPELLQAKQYTGPEVDIWSFGVVLYVLVCGKVPFDDQSMPQLHAKIKKGNVEYPPWLTSECKSLIGRMLVTDPRQRASLTEIMNHPWMTKGFSGPVENYLPHREPITLPLDPAVIQKMNGFDFGPTDYIQAQLTKILESDRYQRAVRQASQKNMNPPETHKSGGMFGFYKRRGSTTSKDNLNSSTDGLPLGEDATNAFAPMLSVYYLAREKIAREQQQSNPGASSLPTAPGEQPLKMPDLPSPPAAVTNANSYEMQGENTGGRTRPRARTRGEDEVAPNAAAAKETASAAIEKPKPVQEPTLAPTPAQAQNEQNAAKKESTASAIIRRISTRRKRPDFSDKVTTPQVAITSPSDTGPVGPRQSFQGRFPGRADPASSASLQATTGGKHPPELLTPPGTENTGFPRRFMSLRRAASVDRRRLRRGGSEAHVIPPTSGSDGSTNQIKDQKSTPADLAGTTRTADFGSRTKSLGHARRESIQARRAAREHEMKEPVKEETSTEVARPKREPTTDHEGGEEVLKPVYLKGLFSVSTTSSKPLTYIRSDIIRVLRDLGVNYNEIAGGFRCHHAPSIKDAEKSPLPANLSPETAQNRNHSRKVSFQGLKDGQKETDPVRSPSGTPRTPKQGIRGQDGSPGISDTDSESNMDDKRRSVAPRSSSARDAGATSTHVRDEMSRNMIVDFEIFIVKVPLLRLHGIQFKKVDGNIMQYKTLAQEILTKLRL